MIRRKAVASPCEICVVYKLSYINKPDTCGPFGGISTMK